jgi:hypothetical protein
MGRNTSRNLRNRRRKQKIRKKLGQQAKAGAKKQQAK